LSGICHDQSPTQISLKSFNQFLVTGILQVLPFDIGNIFALLGPAQPLIGGTIAAAMLIYLFILPAYRAKLAAEVYGERDTGFWNAHILSGTMLRVHLSFLPIIGKLFEKNDSVVGTEGE